jgi:hypothetical protein
LNPPPLLFPNPNVPKCIQDLIDSLKKVDKITTEGGISVYRSGQWVNYTTANGLTSNRVYKLALDGGGAVWASTYGGVVKFNGTKFESVNAPFIYINIYDLETINGQLWISSELRNAEGKYLNGLIVYNGSFVTYMKSGSNIMKRFLL